MTAPDLCGEPGWVPVTIPDLISERSFVSGDPDGDRLQLRYYHRGDGHLLAKIWFGPGTSGPPGHAHGGSQAAALDELMGTCAWMNGHAVLAGEITIRFLAMLPLDTLCAMEAHIHAIEGRKVLIRSALIGPQNQRHSEGSGTFIILPPDTWKGAAHRAAARFKAKTDAFTP